MAGHLFGYEAALAIDALALPLRAGRGAIEALIAASSAMGEGLGTGDDTLILAHDGETLLKRLNPDLEPVANRYFDGLRAGSYDGQLEAVTAVRLAARCATPRRHAARRLSDRSGQVGTRPWSHDLTAGR